MTAPRSLKCRLRSAAGKTHALLSLYHLISDPQTTLQVPGVRDALGDLDIPLEARVLVFDGQEASVEPMLKENGASVSTMWGELAFQVDPSVFNRLVIDSDSNGVAPGNAIFRQVLEAASPCLILIDELVSYLVKLRFSNARRSQNLYRQTVQFLQEMFQLAGNTEGVCVLISLPQSRTEFGGIDPEQLSRELTVVPDLQARAEPRRLEADSRERRRDLHAHEQAALQASRSGGGIVRRSHVPRRLTSARVRCMTRRSSPLTTSSST